MKVDWSDVKDYEVCTECAKVFAGRITRPTHRKCLKRFFFDYGQRVIREDLPRLIVAA